jgi:hypothetical protein
MWDFWLRAHISHYDLSSDDEDEVSQSPNICVFH